MISFGERLKMLRQEKEVTQAEIGKLIGVSSRMVSFYESNTNIPRDAEAFIKLAKFFGVSLDYLFGLSDIKNYDSVIKSLKMYRLLPEEGRQEADEYMVFLKQKYNKKS